MYISGPHLLIAAVIIILLIAFIITMLVLNANAKKFIAANTFASVNHLNVTLWINT